MEGGAHRCETSRATQISSVPGPLLCPGLASTEGSGCLGELTEEEVGVEEVLDRGGEEGQEEEAEEG